MSRGEAAGASVPASAKLFNTTHWSIVQRAKEESITALGHLFAEYREPMIVHLLGKHYIHSRDEAEEFVQGFCVHLLKRNFLGNVAQSKGRFRTFLLTSLDHYLHDKLDEANALKRGSGRAAVSLDATDTQGEPLHSPASSAASADLEYDQAWACAVLGNSLRQLEEESGATGHASLCQALEPALYGDETSPSYREIAGRLGLTEGAVKTAAHRLRRRLRGLIQEQIMQTVSNEEEYHEELAYLIKLLGRSRS